MSYLYEALEKPTRLYIKQCPHCGLKYFGKSIKHNLEKYPGSGVYWKNHLKKYNVKPIHLWNSDWYCDTSISRFALKFSKINKIKESAVWANMIDENGIDGLNFIGGYIQSVTAQKRLKNKTHNFLTTEHSTEHSDFMKLENKKRLKNGTHNFSGKNNPTHKQLENGIHNTQQNYICTKCGKVGKGPVMKRFHFDNCKQE